VLHIVVQHHIGRVIIQCKAFETNITSGDMLTIIAKALHSGWFRRNKAGGIVSNALRVSLTPEGNQLPRVVHSVIPPSATLGRRVILVGDVHGCRDEVERLLNRLYFRPAVDILVFVGDLVNKGPDSVGSLRLAQEYNALAVQGNHEDRTVAARKASDAGVPIKEKYAWAKDADLALIDYMHELPLTIELKAYNAAIVHAGIVPGKHLHEQLPEDMLLMRDCVFAAALNADSQAGGSEPDEEEESGDGAGRSNASSWNWDAVIKAQEEISDNALLNELRGSERRHPAGAGWASVYRGPPHLFFGHDAKRRLQIEPWATGLDTGCVYGGSLTAAVLPPLDEHGVPIDGRSPFPADVESQEIVMGSGLKIWLVSVPASAVHCQPKPKQIPDEVLNASSPLGS
jgi:predicted phosphodiesterase